MLACASTRWAVLKGAGITGCFLVHVKKITYIGTNRQWQRFILLRINFTIDCFCDVLYDRMLVY